MPYPWISLLAALALVASPTPPVSARQIELEASLAQPLLEAGKKQVTYLKVGLTGFALDNAKQRAPVNVAIVLDKSGSMSGDKLAKAKDAAIAAVERLTAEDVVSIVTYDTSVNVLVPATKLSDRSNVIQQIRQIEAQGSTALHAGVAKGAEELRKFISKDRVNRVILLSDGLANVGPQTPDELASLGRELAQEGISVSTIGLGLGYNEDLMTRLAAASDGNHVFVEKSSDLIAVFNREFNDVLSVVAQEVVVKVHCENDVRPVRILNLDAEISGNDVIVKLNQIYSKQQKYLILELELPPQKSGNRVEVANVSVAYTNMETKQDDRLSSTVSAEFSVSLAKVEAATNKPVMVECVIQLANLQNQQATLLRDKGDVAGARALLRSNADYLKLNAMDLDSPALLGRAADNEAQAATVADESKWNRNRKDMRARQYSEARQQAQP
ncbi:MAG: VWA domain-containing protein [Planctomycetales bacterium]|nr:VWA domain-containing protein [Planctomycetales bacterium]MCA9169611.1 VWA domain-containing protein [Planctomycetales bacterium]